MNICYHLSITSVTIPVQANFLFLICCILSAVNGGYNTEVLCQEFLRGKEYVIDQVSRDGIHKTMMVWVYDKRPANNSAFVYFGMVPVDPTSMEARILIPYARGVLDALGVKNGPSHAEVSFSLSFTRFRSFSTLMFTFVNEKLRILSKLGHSHLVRTLSC